MQSGESGGETSVWLYSRLGESSKEGNLDPSVRITLPASLNKGDISYKISWFKLRQNISTSAFLFVTK